MAKRFGDNATNIPKKQKLDPDATFWDDDMDDDCFNKIATQILEKDVVGIPPSQANVSIMPSYDSFKPNIPFASTQHTIIPSQIKTQQPEMFIGESFEDLKMKVKYLQQKCEAKEGEVSILRSQIHKMKIENTEDQNKKLKDHIESTNLKDKELKNIQGQLEFKNLEIANLKQKILDMNKSNIIKGLSDENRTPDTIKRSRVESTFKTSSKDSPQKTRKSKILDELNTEIIILEQPEFPLLYNFSADLFENLLHEVHVVETRSNQYEKNTIPYLHNQMMQKKVAVPSGPKVTIKVGKEEISLEYIYPEIFKIMQCNSFEINSRRNRPLIDKVLAMSIQLLQYFKQYLELLEKNCHTEENEQLDKNFLRSNSNGESEEQFDPKCQIGVRAGKTVQFIAELLPYSTYLSDFAVFSKEIQFDESLLESFTFLKEPRDKDYYLLLLNDILKKIFTLKKAKACHCFLNAVGALLVSLSKDNFYSEIFSVFSTLMESLLITRPQMAVLHKLLIVFKNCSTSKEFVQFLCHKQNQNNSTTEAKRKSNLLEESCKFTFFVSLLNNKLRDINDEKLSLDITLNVLSFIHNIFVMNPSWMHNSQKDDCVCLRQLYELAVEVLYKNLKQYKITRNSSLKEMYISIFKCGIEIFELLSFNSFDLVEKSMENLSRYREVCNGLMELQSDLLSIDEICSLQKLNIFEDVPIVPSSKFDLL